MTRSKSKLCCYQSEIFQCDKFKQANGLGFCQRHYNIHCDRLRGQQPTQNDVTIVSTRAVEGANLITATNNICADVAVPTRNNVHRNNADNHINNNTDAPTTNAVQSNNATITADREVTTTTINTQEGGIDDDDILYQAPCNTSVANQDHLQFNYSRIEAFISKQFKILDKKESKSNKKQFEYLKRQVESLKSRVGELTELLHERKKKPRTSADDTLTLSNSISLRNRNPGIINEGTTCYLNAYIQVIASLSFLPECLSREPRISADRFPLYHSLAKLITSMVKDDRDETVSAKQFSEKVKSTCKDFLGFDQRKYQKCQFSSKRLSILKT